MTVEEKKQTLYTELLSKLATGELNKYSVLEEMKKRLSK